MMLRRPRYTSGDSRYSGVPAMALAALIAVIAGCDATDPQTSEAMEDEGRLPVAATGPDTDESWEPEFTADGSLVLPEAQIWREWPYIGTPLTPNALNDGEAAFPEFHSVYIDPASLDHWRRTGTFRDGTVLAKELVSVIAEGGRPDGSTDQVSGRGYFMGDFIGFEIAYKSTEHFPDEPGNWAYFTFGHHPLPYAPSASRQPVEACNSCHDASAADDFVFTQFYPVLRAAQGSR
jgi:hypothetical protein